MRNEALIIENASGEGPGILHDILSKKGWLVQTVQLHQGRSIPSNWQCFNLLIVMGGPMNVYEEDKYPYLIKETEVIGEALNGGMPLLGFCLGAQLMAKACGARVLKGHIREIGWYPARLTEDGRKDLLLRWLPEEFFVFQWHSDTFQIPERGIRLIESDEYPNQAIRIGKMSYGFQFHFEITGEMIEDWLQSGKEEVKELNVAGLHERILKDTSYHLPKIHAVTELFLNNYLDQIEVRMN
jgi:GMP synthase (glutamine-hydrolysing)